LSRALGSLTEGALLNVFGTLLTVLAIVVGAVFLIPVLGVLLGLAVAFGGVLLWVLPIILIAASDKVGTAEKILWILAIIFLSWFAWIFYFFFAPLFDRPQRHSYY
jgi:TctA family transporter